MNEIAETLENTTERERWDISRGTANNEESGSTVLRDGPGEGDEDRGPEEQRR